MGVCVWGGGVNKENHLAPGGCDMNTRSLNPPVFVVGIDLADRGCSLEV